MNSNFPTPVNVPYLPTSRNYTADVSKMSAELRKSYFETAQAVNNRTIGSYNTDSSVTGNQYYSNNNISPANPIQYRQSSRAVFPFATISAGATLNITHGISGITQCVAIYGTCITANPDFRPIPYSSASSVNSQIEVKVTSTQITIINGSSSPNITSGMIVLEYLLN